MTLIYFLIHKIYIKYLIVKYNHFYNISLSQYHMDNKVVLKKHWFIDSKKGNIKEEFYFEKKLGSGGYGTVYQARKKSTGIYHYFPSLSKHHLLFKMSLFLTFFIYIGEHVAIKAIQKTQVQDY